MEQLTLTDMMSYGCTYLSVRTCVCTFVHTYVHTYLLIKSLATTTTFALLLLHNNSNVYKGRGRAGTLDYVLADCVLNYFEIHPQHLNIFCIVNLSVI